MNLLPSRRPAASRTRGFTMIEVTIAIVLLTIGFLGFGSLFVMNARSWNVANEQSLVLNALRDTAERLRSAPFAPTASPNILSQYPSSYTFNINDIPAGIADIPVIVTYFLNETDSSSDAVKLGLPRDLNGDGDAADTNVSADYRLLPVMIQASWTDLMGSRSEALYLMLAQEKT